jgi:hypothetical protein
LFIFNNLSKTLLSQDGKTVKNRGPIILQEGKTAKSSGPLILKAGKTAKISVPLIVQEGKTAIISGLLILHKGKSANFEKSVPSSGGVSTGILYRSCYNIDRAVKCRNVPVLLTSIP